MGNTNPIEGRLVRLNSAPVEDPLAAGTRRIAVDHCDILVMATCGGFLAWEMKSTQTEEIKAPIRSNGA